MGQITEHEIRAYIEQNIPNFHRRRLQKLNTLELKDVLLRKNPYLFRAKNINTASDLVRGILDAYLSSQEETIFGEFLEGLAIFVCKKVYGGRESTAEGIDLEFEKGDNYYIVSIKSGPNWGNSSQIIKMKENFRKAKRILRTHGLNKNIVAVNGCCYGRTRKEEMDDYIKLCGQRFWALISGNDSLYTEIIEPLGHKAKERNEEFAAEYAKVVNRFTRDFIDGFCEPDGSIVWEKLVRFNSAASPNKPICASAGKNAGATFDEFTG